MLRIPSKPDRNQSKLTVHIGQGIILLLQNLLIIHTSSTYLALSTYSKKDPLALYSLYEQVCIEMAFYPEDQTSGLYVSPIKTLGPYKAISLAKAQMTTVVVSISFYSYKRGSKGNSLHFSDRVFGQIIFMIFVLGIFFNETIV